MFTKSEYTKISNKRPWDITIVAWPKSGMTWLQNIVASIMYDAVGMNTPLSVVRELIQDVHEKTRYMRHSERMFFKSHGLPRDIDTKYALYLVRDGRDALLSYYHYLNNTEQPHKWDELVSKYQHGDIWPGKWGDHVNSWRIYSAVGVRIHVAFLRYEDLLGDDAVDAIKQALFDLEFPSHSRFMSDSVIDKALRVCSFEKMAEREKMSPAKNMKRGSFMRSGRSEQWRYEMPRIAVDLFNATKEMSALKAFGYEKY